MRDDRDVHTEHCCLIHGCKYGDEDCPVATGKKAQSFECEDCAEEVETVGLTRLRELEAENARLRIAFHDAIRRPLGVTPDSGAEFYDARMAYEAEARRAGKGLSSP